MAGEGHLVRHSYPLTLDDFSVMIEKEIDGLLERRTDDGHYAICNTEMPLSVTPIEGRVLFALARVFKPARILEIGTGTGYSCAWIAAGAPHAEVITVDNFVEGKPDTVGPEVPTTIWKRLGLTNINLRIEDFTHNTEGYIKWGPGFVFIDGPLSRSIQSLINVQDGGLLVLHDMLPGISIKHPSIRLATPSVIGIHAHENSIDIIRRVTSLIVEEDSFEK